MKGHKLAPFEQNLKSDLDSLENNFKTEQIIQQDKGLQQVTNHLLRTDARSHNKYCPCCRENPNDGTAPLTTKQLSEFMDYNRTLHDKLSTNKKPKLPREDLDYDSIDEVTDLE